MEGRLRKLQEEDAPYMLEWMHDSQVIEFMGANFGEKTLEDCKRFIEASKDEQEDLNLAVVDDEDTYMGTVSLKHIDKQEKNAEFAIAMRSSAMGKGYAIAGMKQILEEGFLRLGLEKIYWCVSSQNKRAVRFYEKNGFKRTGEVPEKIRMRYTEEQLTEFYWYQITDKN